MNLRNGLSLIAAFFIQYIGLSAQAEILYPQFFTRLTLFNHNDEARALVITDNGAPAVSIAKVMLQINKGRAKPIELKILTSGGNAELDALANKYPSLIKLQRNGAAESWMQDYGEPVRVKKLLAGKMTRAFYDSWRDANQDAYFKPFLESETLDSFRIHPRPNDAFSLGKTGDLGGNIEATPNDVLYVGTTASDELKDFFRKKGYNEEAKNLAVLDVGWLATGHVDEIVSTLPVKGDACGFAIVRASPMEAIEVLKKTPKADFDQLETRLAASGQAGSELDLFDLKKLYYAIHGDPGVYGRNQLDGQPQIEARLKAAAEQLASVIKAKSPECAKVKIVTIPNLYVCYSETNMDLESSDHDPSQIPGVFKNPKSGLCKSATSSLINLVSLNEHVLTLDPRLESIKARFSATMKSLGKTAHYVDDNEANLNVRGGGMHCISQVIRDETSQIVKRGK